jgi:hypothetical protein
MANNRKTTKQTQSRPADESLGARTLRTVNRQPYTSAAIAAGAIGAVAAVAGLILLRKSDKSLGELTNDVTTRVKDGLADAGSKAKETVSKLRADPPKTQSQIAEEALTLKETGAASPTVPFNASFDDQTNSGVFTG